MQPVSSAYRREQKKAMAAPARVRIRFVAGGPDAAGESGDTGHTAWSRLDALSLAEVPADAAYATLEPGRTRADGRLRALPDDAADYGNEGFVSDALSGADGTFAAAPALWFRFGAPQEAPGLTLAFDEAAGEWPAEVRVAVLDSAGRPLLDEAFFPQSPVLDIRRPLDGFRQVCITFARCAPRRRARLSRISFGTEVTLEGAGLCAVRQVLEVDPIGRRLPENSLAFSVVNVNQLSPGGGGHSYDPDDPGGLWEYLDKNRPVELRWGQELAGGDGQAAVEWLAGGHYYLTGRPKVQGLLARFTARDLLGALEAPFEKGVYAPAGRSLYDLALDVLTDEGLPGVLRLARPWHLWEGLRDIRTTAPLPARSGRECLQLLAHAGRCALYTARDGAICIQPLPQADTGLALGPADMLGEALVDKTARPGAVRCAVYRARPRAEESELYAAVIPVEGEARVHITYAASMGQQAAVSGAGIALAEARLYAQAADLTLTGTGEARLTVTGHALAWDKSWASVPGEGDGAAAEFDNPLLTSPAMALETARWALSHLGLRSTYSFETRGCPEADPLDVFELTGAFGAGPARILRCETSYSGGLRTKLTAKRLPGAGAVKGGGR